MQIRDAAPKDAKQILNLLRQVLELHAAIRPDLFVSGTTKYTEAELHAIFRDPARRTWVAAEENGDVLGYVFCEIRDHTDTNNMVPHTELYIDDLCVDSGARGRQIGRHLFRHVQQAAAQMGCYEITLNVWTGNDGARAFYEKMGMRPQATHMELILR